MTKATDTLNHLVHATRWAKEFDVLLTVQKQLDLVASLNSLSDQSSLVAMRSLYLSHVQNARHFDLTRNLALTVQQLLESFRQFQGASSVPLRNSAEIHSTWQTSMEAHRNIYTSLLWDKLAFLHGALSAISEEVDAGDASTSPSESAIDQIVEEEFLAIVTSEDNVLSDREETIFSDNFRTFVTKYGLLGIRVFERFCVGEGSRIAVIAEGLRELGRMTDSNTHEMRMQLLRKCLTHPSPTIRDAAGLGLSLLGDKRAIPSLERAIHSERLPLCKMVLEGALAEMRS